MTKRPMINAIMASAFLVWLLTSPRRKRPSMPAAKMPESCHQVSSMLLTPIIPMPVTIARMPMIKVDLNNMWRVCPFVRSFLI